ncbi:EAL domain-containing protein [Acetobacter sp. AN02]|nr:EAL domain-containing protein [Acetobacter sp. AN02]
MLTDQQAAVIVDAIISLCSGLNIKVVAEGIETTGQLASLRRYPELLIQGYLIGKPQPKDRLYHLSQPQRLGV